MRKGNSGNLVITRKPGVDHAAAARFSVQSADALVAALTKPKEVA